MTPPLYHLRSPRVRAFTLVELLTVIGIIGILAGILIPVVAKVRSTADNAQCVSALRHHGLALQLYVNDRRDRKLPGPLFGLVLPITRLSGGQPANNHLFSYLAPYLSLTAASTNRFLPEEYLCGGWLRKAPVNWQENNTPAYVLNTSVRVPDVDTNRNPWGNANNSGTVKTYSYTDIVSENEIARTWVMRDLDALNTSGATAAKLPEKPVHGAHRNQLYFDWHVGAVSTDS